MRFSGLMNTLLEQNIFVSREATVLDINNIMSNDVVHVSAWYVWSFKNCY